MPGLGISLILIAVGAVLTFAVATTTSAVAIPTVGVILMIVGGIGLLMTLLFLMSLRHSRANAVITSNYVRPDRKHVS